MTSEKKEKVQTLTRLIQMTKSQHASEIDKLKRDHAFKISNLNQIHADFEESCEIEALKQLNIIQK